MEDQIEYLIELPDGRPTYHYIGPSEEETKEMFLADKMYPSWKEAETDGYKCKKVRISEIY